MASLDAVVANVIAVLAAVPGVKTSQGPLEQANGPFPLAMTRMDAGSWQLNSANGPRGHPTRWGAHTLKIRLVHPRIDLPHDMAALSPLTELVVDALLRQGLGFAGGNLFGGSILGLGDMVSGGRQPPLRYTTGSFGTGGNEMLTVEFDLDVTVEEDIT